MFERTVVPNCSGDCVPATRTETKVVNKFGDAAMTIQLTGDQSAVVVQAGAAAKAVAPAQ